MNIPAFSLSRQIKNNKAVFTAALDKVMETQQFIGGTFIQEIEKKLADYLGATFVISCNSGTDALWMALHAMQLPENAIVLTTPFSFIASSSEIVANKAHPVFIDIEKDTFNINPELAAAWLEKNAFMQNGKAVHKATGFPIVGMVPVDLFGQTADYVLLKELADIWGLWIIEDCAQSIGASLEGKKAGTFGDIGAFSFYPTKNLGAFGDGGCLTTDNPVLAERLLQMRNHGRKANYDYEAIGVNSRLDAFQAVVLSEKLPHLDAANQRRNQIAQRYNQAFANLAWLQTPQEILGTHVYHQYTLLLSESTLRPIFEKHLTALGVQSRIFYPKALCDFDFLNTHPVLKTDCPVAVKAAQTVISLPMWPELEDAEVTYIIESVLAFEQQPVLTNPEAEANV
jgi:dTDP-4-amino-4,6-dideoxygalactose transaminase